VSAAAGCLLCDDTYDGEDPTTSKYFWDAVYISYLPLAHSFELNMQILVLSCASAIGFYQVRFSRQLPAGLGHTRPACASAND
jgi:hypothetical protein